MAAAFVSEVTILPQYLSFVREQSMMMEGDEALSQKDKTWHRLFPTFLDFKRALRTGAVQTTIDSKEKIKEA